MIIVLEQEVANLELATPAIMVVETYDFNLPSGITNSIFTAKGSIIVGTGAGTYTEFPASPTAGQAIVSVPTSASGLGYSSLDAAFPPLFKVGLTLSNNVSDANNDIDIATGSCRDSADLFNFRLTTGLTKRLDASWTVGTNQGGLDTGSKANSTWYHVYIIRKDSDGTMDALFSTSATSPTMPTGYTYKRRIGAVRTNGSGNILAFYQNGSRFMWPAQIAELSGSATTATAFTITAPLGVKTMAIGVAAINPSTSSFIHVFDPDITTASTPAFWTAYSPSTATALGIVHQMTNLSSQLKYYIGNGTGLFYTWGYEELWLT